MGTRALPSTRFDPLLCQQLGCSAESADVRRVSPETMRRGWSVLNGVWHRKRQRKTKGGGKNGHPAGSFSQELGVFHVGEKRSLAEIFVVDYGWASTPIELSLRYIRYNSSFQTKEELSLGFPLSFHSSFRGSKINFSRGILIRFPVCCSPPNWPTMTQRVPLSSSPPKQMARSNLRGFFLLLCRLIGLCRSALRRRTRRWTQPLPSTTRFRAIVAYEFFASTFIIGKSNRKLQSLNKLNFFRSRFFLNEYSKQRIFDHLTKERLIILFSKLDRIQ